MMNVRLGRKPPIHDPRTLKLSTYLIPDQIAPPPATLDLTGITPVYPMFANDRLGDCTCAAAGHMVEVWTAKMGNLDMPTDDEIIGLYDKVNGGRDDGAAMLDVLRVWQSDGLAGEKPLAYMKVDHTNLDHVKTAMFLFQGLYVGVSLPVSAQNETNVWAITTDTPGSWGGHAVPGFGYNPEGVIFCTWGRMVTATWAWFDKYVEELWAVLPSEWSGPGVDMPALERDLHQLADD